MENKNCSGNANRKISSKQLGDELFKMPVPSGMNRSPLHFSKTGMCTALEKIERAFLSGSIIVIFEFITLPHKSKYQKHELPKPTVAFAYL